MRNKAAGYLLVPLALMLTSCGGLADLVSVDPEDLSSVTASAASIPADGASRVTITVKVPAAADLDAREIELETNSGLFFASDGDLDVSVDLIADINGYASAELQSSTAVGTARIQAKSTDSDDRVVIQTMEVSFTRVYPDRIELTSDRSVLSESDEDVATLTARLLYGAGFASQGTAVDWTAADDFGRPTGVSNTSSSDEDGEAGASLVAAGNPYRGGITIVARVTHPDTGAVVEGRIRIHIVD